MDSITKWLVRLASAIIILGGLIISLLVPIIAFKVTSQVSIFQTSIKEILLLFLDSIKT